MQHASRFDSALCSLVIAYPSLARDRRAVNWLFVFFELVSLGVLARDVFKGSETGVSIFALEVVIGLHLCWNAFMGLAIAVKSQESDGPSVVRASGAIPAKWILLFTLWIGLHTYFFLLPVLIEIVRSF
jgi:hypothetical protein